MVVAMMMVMIIACAYMRERKRLRDAGCETVPMSMLKRCENHQQNPNELSRAEKEKEPFEEKRRLKRGNTSQQKSTGHGGMPSVVRLPAAIFNMLLKLASKTGFVITLKETQTIPLGHE